MIVRVTERGDPPAVGEDVKSTFVTAKSLITFSASSFNASITVSRSVRELKFLKAPLPPVVTPTVAPISPL